MGSAADNLGEPLADFPVQKAHDLAHALERKTLAPQFADHGHLGQLSQRKKPPVPFPLGLYDAALVPPLKLARCNAGQGDHLLRCEPILHSLSTILFETILAQNVSNSLGVEWRRSRTETVEK